MTKLPAEDMWRATSEPKCKFFSWLVLQDKVLTTDNMTKKIWTCDPMCSLCFSLLETTPHLLIECNYTETVWDIVAAHFTLPSFRTLHAQGGLLQWTNFLRSTGSKREKDEAGYPFHFLVADVDREKPHNFLAQRNFSALPGHSDQGSC
jgi:hypothetical protein